MEEFGVIFFPLDFDDEAFITMVHSIEADPYNLKLEVLNSFTNTSIRH